MTGTPQRPAGPATGPLAGPPQSLHRRTAGRWGTVEEEPEG
jgi:hypothetical protein